MEASDLSKRVRVSSGGEEFHRLTGVINSLLERLERAFQAQRRLVADAAHELKTPIAVLLGEAQDALRPESAPGDRRRSLETIERTAQGLAREAANLLLLARADAASAASLELVDLGAIAERSVASSRGLAALRDVQIDLFRENGAPLRGDRDALLRLATNLIANAAVYTEPGTSVEVAAGTRGPRISGGARPRPGRSRRRPLPHLRALRAAGRGPGRIRRGRAWVSRSSTRSRARMEDAWRWKTVPAAVRSSGWCFRRLFPRNELPDRRVAAMGWCTTAVCSLRPPSRRPLKKRSSG